MGISNDKILSMTEHRYQLDNSRPKRKAICPNCGKRSLVRYVDLATGEPLGEGCGRCDHEQSCGYHYPPREYFRDNPQNSVPQVTAVRIAEPKPQLPAGIIPDVYLKESLLGESDFTRWLLTVFPAEAVAEAARRYQLGTTRQGDRLGSRHDGNVIFWQRTADGELRAGKIMQYGPDGHRRGNPYWVHSALIRNGQLPSDWNLRQCLFGEHLLAQYPDMEVALVESEKTAVFCSLRFPGKLWLATGGCGGLSQEKLQPLVGRKLTIYPDSGKLKEWFRKVAFIPGMQCNFDVSLERYPSNTDLVDILL